jgi:tetratricopeptide (TPR) repeat protein
MRGDREERNAAIARCVELDPLWPFDHAISGFAYGVTGDHIEAVALTEKGRTLDPNSIPTPWVGSTAHLHAGDLDRALHHAARAVELGQRGSNLLGTLGRALARMGRRDEARIEESLRRNIAADTGPATVCVVLVHELARLLEHPRLGALVRRLPPYTGR